MVIYIKHYDACKYYNLCNNCKYYNFFKEYRGNRKAYFLGKYTEEVHH